MQTQSLTPVLLTNLRDAWKAYVRTRVSKGLPENEKVPDGNEDAVWLRISELYQKSEWRQECLKRDEKFDLHYSSAVSPLPAHPGMSRDICLLLAENFGCRHCCSIPTRKWEHRPRRRSSTHRFIQRCLITITGY